MLQDGLFERFPCGSVFGMHNRPDLPIGKYFHLKVGAMPGAQQEKVHRIVAK
jgi:hippurate hydrolase